MYHSIVLILVSLLLSSASAANQRRESASTSDAGEPLILTDYLPGDIEYARQLARVPYLEMQHADGSTTAVEAYSGYFTVNKTTNSNMFFVFVLPTDPDMADNSTIACWLQGGPGASSMYGLFEELGPFTVSSSDGTTLLANENAWTRKYPYIFIDNPVGVGLSFTDSPDGFVTNEVEVGRNMHSLLSQFFVMFPEWQTADFYVSGESYGGKYSPATAYYIHTQNELYDQGLPLDNTELLEANLTVRIPLAGFSVGDGAMDPYSMFSYYDELLFWIGAVTEQEKEVISTFQEKFLAAMRAEEWADAFHVFDSMLNGDFYPYPTLFHNITGLVDYFSFLSPVYADNPYPEYLQSLAGREQFHVGGHLYADYNATVEEFLINDWMKTVQPYVEVLVDNYRALIYNGAVDIILGAPACEKFLQQLDWSGADEFATAAKQIWIVQGESATTTSNLGVAGYVRQVQDLVQVVVREAGHMVPLDQPVRAFDMIDRFFQKQTDWGVETPF